MISDNNSQKSYIVNLKKKNPIDDLLNKLGINQIHGINNRFMDECFWSFWFALNLNILCFAGNKHDFTSECMEIRIYIARKIEKRKTQNMVKNYENN